MMELEVVCGTVATHPTGSIDLAVTLKDFIAFSRCENYNFTRKDSAPCSQDTFRTSETAANRLTMS
jgi:hypothetical protein